MAPQNNIEICTDYSEYCILPIIVNDGCNCEHVDEAVNNIVKNIDPNVKFNRINIACNHDVHIDVINYVIQKICAEIEASELYVYAPSQIAPNIIYPAGVKIHRSC
jgi:hypothetical protein